MPALSIRYGQPDDLPALAAIYDHYVSSGYITFDDQPLNLEDRRALFDAYKETGPYRIVVADLGGAVLGSATSSPYRAHPAFRQTIEVGIYLDPLARGQGLGTVLYEFLFAALEGQGLHRLWPAVPCPTIGRSRCTAGWDSGKSASSASMR